jgi:hypothetical protein
MVSIVVFLWFYVLRKYKYIIKIINLLALFNWFLCGYLQNIAIFAPFKKNKLIVFNF